MEKNMNNEMAFHDMSHSLIKLLKRGDIGDYTGDYDRGY